MLFSCFLNSIVPHSLSQRKKKKKKTTQRQSENLQPRAAVPQSLHSWKRHVVECKNQLNTTLTTTPKASRKLRPSLQEPSASCSRNNLVLSQMCFFLTLGMVRHHGLNSIVGVYCWRNVVYDGDDTVGRWCVLLRWWCVCCSCVCEHTCREKVTEGWTHALLYVCVYMCVHTEYTHNYLTSITVPLYSNNKEPNCSLSPPGLSMKKYNSTTDTVVQRV